LEKSTMSLPQTDEHICVNCKLTFPKCGVKRRQKEGYCTRCILK
jgi:uncharacterized Fe-S radical SAM superfamily protein PflX